MNGTTPVAHQAGAAAVSISACVGNCGSDDVVTVDEILTAVNNALNGCVQTRQT